MNEFPVIGSSRLRKDFWDRHWANNEECKTKGCFDVQKAVFVRDHRFFAAILTEVDVDTIDRRGAQGFV